MKNKTSIANLLYENYLFNLVKEVGEILTKKLHIIDTGDGGQDFEQSYRVYHSDGYCFDVWKEDASIENDENEYTYGFYSEWPGFTPLPIRDTILLMEAHFKKKPLISNSH